jgi:uncharacterized protein YdiU (UPF0061 family)
MNLPEGLSNLKFDNRFTLQLPGDPTPANTRRQVFGACYSRVRPTPVSRPQTIAWSKEVAELLDLSEADCQSTAFAEVFGGNRQLEGMDPFAMCYGGHQFGNWAGQLGDGRAINLGEVRNRRNEHWTLQLKGAGPTPYSRTADGLAVLRSSLREFLCSEAMYHLGVPTTRALSLVLTGEQVMRDLFYDGNPKPEPGAVVCRVAPSFIRFGNFQIFAARKDEACLRKLVDFTIRNDFAHLIPSGTDPLNEDIFASWFREVCRRTADMIVHWQRVGFVHGVMNTDNMSILGLTIDYGPYGWIDNFDLHWTPNTTDASGRRYRFGQQPQVAMWNLVQLANSLLPLFSGPEQLESALAEYAERFHSEWRLMMISKLGLSEWMPDTDVPLINDLTEMLELVETDMTIFFRKLAQIPVNPDTEAESTQSLTPDNDPMIPAELAPAYYSPETISQEQKTTIQDWLIRYRDRVRHDGTTDTERRIRMNAVNPKYVFRNYLAQQAIELAESGDTSRVMTLLELLRHPYDEQPEHENDAAKRPDWARHKPGCSMLSCSS